MYNTIHEVVPHTKTTERICCGYLRVHTIMFAILFGVALLISGAAEAAYGPSGGSGGGDSGGSTMGGGGNGSGGPSAGGGSGTGGSGSGTTPGTGAGEGGGGSTTPGGGPPEGVTPGGSGGGGEGEEPAVGNNLSFPVIAADGFAITSLNEAVFETAYEGPYTGLTDEERALLEGYEWYAQKTEGNLWQAEYREAERGQAQPVFGIDWGDNIESVHPVIGRPFRLEVTLYQQQPQDDWMTGYTMALLAFPSSPREVQGTNKLTYENEYATVVSNQPKMIVQYLGTEVGDNLTWKGDQWARGDESIAVLPLSFGPELNVGGKYIYGASKGGWKPAEAGWYRLTFHMPGSDISFSEAIVGNYGDWTGAPAGEDEESEDPRAAKPVVDHELNITYADVEVVSKRTGTKPENPGEGEETTVPEVSTVSAVAMAADAAASETTCAPYLTDFLGIGMDNNPEQVRRLQEFLNETMNARIPVTGYFGTLTLEAVKDFQQAYYEEILLPWVQDGAEESVLAQGTGLVYITTLAQINKMVCSKPSA